MKARPADITRNVLRFFEIALFFAVSVLGYSLLAKASTFSAKSKSRSHSVLLQENPEKKGTVRELWLMSYLFPDMRYCRFSEEPDHQWHLRIPGHDLHANPRLRSLPCVSSLENSLLSATASRFQPLKPYNLFQQTPVLLT
jgi:hypothetical protein